MITVALADDHTMFREGLAALLVPEAAIEVIFEAKDGLDLLDRLDSDVPDVLLLDIEMPKMDGLDVLREIKKRKFPTKVLVLTMHKSGEVVKGAIKAVADGYLQKNAGREALIAAITGVIENGHYFTNDIRSLVFESLRESKQTTKITRREKEVLLLITEGFTTREIAEELFLSKHTIESHRQNLLLKLGLKNTAELVKYAIKKGLI